VLPCLFGRSINGFSLSGYIITHVGREIQHTSDMKVLIIICVHRCVAHLDVLHAHHVLRVGTLDPKHIVTVFTFLQKQLVTIQ
jgi:hypothetical protein